MGWNDPLTTLWVQRDGAAELTIGGLTLNDLPVYVLSLPVDETGKVLDASEVQVYEAQKTDTGDIDITLPDVSGNGHNKAIQYHRLARVCFSAAAAQKGKPFSTCTAPQHVLSIMITKR